MNVFNIYNRILYFLLVALITVSCTKFPNNPPIDEEFTDIVDTTVKRKVLIIAIDGLVGSQIKAYKPTNIAKLMEHGKYSFETKADDYSNPYLSWSTLLTGYKFTNHKISQESFMVDINLDKEHAGYDLNQSLMYRLERTDSKYRTASVVQNSTMNAMLLADADSSAVVNSDAAASQRLKNLLELDRSDIILGQFTGLINAGKDGGFTVGNSKYKSALDMIDNYIGDLVSTVEKRENYTKEKWLIIICSPYGGTASGNYGGSTLDEINTFSLYYNKNFKPLEISAKSMSYLHANGYFAGSYQPMDDTLGNKVRLLPSIGVRAQSPIGASSNVFNASNNASKAITFEFKMNILSEDYWRTSDDYRNTALLGKDLDDKVTTKGWSLYTGSVGEYMLLFQNGVDTTGVPFVRARNKWCHYAFSFKQVTSSTTSIEIFEDGVLKVSKIISMGLADFENQDPLTIGFTTISKLYSFPNYQISGLRVWNKALLVDEVKTLACQDDLNASDPLYSNLIAYYKNFSDDKKWINNLGNSAPNLSVSGSATSRIVPFYSLCTTDPNEVYLQTVDVLPQVFYWLDIKLSNDGKLAGKQFLDRYLDEFFRD